TTVVQPESSGSRSKACGSRSITVTRWPSARIAVASAAPTRPQPITTTCILASLTVRVPVPDLRSPVLARYNAGPGFISRPDRPTPGGRSTRPTAVKRLLLGRPYRPDAEPRALLRKRVALPVLASDTISSTAYAPEEIFLVLSVAGLSAYTFTLWVGIAVAIVLAVVVAGYRQNVRAYPSGGGDYEVAATNLGPRAGLLVAAALMVDYVLTVAVSVAAAVCNIGAAVPMIDWHRVLFAVLAVAVIAAINLRGVREAGAVFAVP